MCLYVCMCVCVHAHACMYVCMYICVCIYVYSAEHLTSPMPVTNKNLFGTSHFVKQLVRKQ